MFVRTFSECSYVDSRGIKFARLITLPVSVELKRVRVVRLDGLCSILLSPCELVEHLRYDQLSRYGLITQCVANSDIQLPLTILK